MFSKILNVLVILTAVSFAAAPTDGINDATYEWGAVLNISIAANDDSLTSGTDSVIVATDFVPERGYEYIHVRDANTGSGSDSSYYYVVVRCKDKIGGAVLYSVNIDTVTAADGEAIKIPFGETLIGGAFDIKLKAVNGSTGVPVILNRSYLYTRKPIVTNKAWR